ncbi:hypothetical protein EVG20_g9420 [Dentipellis fragilis]|uniref:Uncharacterized protein n=1 Tax=Dentipellis fragilis TaxID=205917 RepID=A0A4Y9XZP8_9AGAM|nr:hypothetical protein EVG20_g9420 [Dentipellis fragilis]
MFGAAAGRINGPNGAAADVGVTLSGYYGSVPVYALYTASDAWRSEPDYSRSSDPRITGIGHADAQALILSPYTTGCSYCLHDALSIRNYIYSVIRHGHTSTHPTTDMACSEVYRDQLATLKNGHALWEPDPDDTIQQVGVGDVGYVLYGGFQRLFNIHLAADHPSQGKHLPEYFEPLHCEASHIYHRTLRPGPYRSRSVVAAKLDAPFVVPAGGKLSLKFACSRRKGAVLVLPEKALREDTKRRGAYKEYLREHCEQWHTLTEQLKLDLRMEDLVLVTGCDRTTTWAVAAFTNTDFDSQIQLSVELAGVEAASFASSLSWSHDENAQRHWGPDPETSVSMNELSGAVTKGEDISTSSQKQRQKQEPVDPHGSVDGDSDGGGVPINPGEVETTAEVYLPGEVELTREAGSTRGADAIGEADATGETYASRDMGSAEDVSNTCPKRGQGDTDTHDHTDMMSPLLDYILQSSDVDLAIAHHADLYPYTESATSASEIAQYLKEDQPSVFKTVLQGVAYGSIDYLDKDVSFPGARRRKSSGSRVTFDEDNIQYIPRSQFFPPSPISTESIQSTPPPSIPPQPALDSPPLPSLSPFGTKKMLSYPDSVTTRADTPPISYMTQQQQIGPSITPDGTPIYMPIPNLDWGGNYYSPLPTLPAISQTTPPRVSRTRGRNHEAQAEMDFEMWTGLDLSDVATVTNEDEQPGSSVCFSTSTSLAPSTELLVKDFIAAFNEILFVGEGRRETQHHRIMMTYMRQLDRKGLAIERQLACLRHLTDVFAKAKPKTHLDADSLDEFANKVPASQLKVPTNYHSALLKLALFTPYTNSYHASGLLADIAKGVFPSLPVASKSSLSFDISFSHLTTVGLTVIPTYRLDEHLQLKGNNIVKIFKLDPLIIPTLRTYHTNRIAIALGVEDIGKEILASWRALIEGSRPLSYMFAGMLDLTNEQLNQISHEVRFAYAVPSRFVAREKQLQELIRYHKRWPYVALEDLNNLRRANSALFYGVGAALLALVMVQVQVLLYYVLKIAAGSLATVQ